MPRDHLAQARGLRRWQIVLPLLLAWAAAVALSLFMHRNDIAILRFSDPDDTMRLLQVRDFLAGQGWFDVTQHRANPPVGGPMHWSRLVDLPIAAIILLLRPFAGDHGAEIGAVLAVPALTLALLMYVLFWAIRPLTGEGRALVCCAAFAITPFIFVQCGAMRIDHHAWQAVMMALALRGILHGDPHRGGVLAGLAMAAWLQISIEGMPYAVLAGAVMTVRHAFGRDEWPRLAAYLWTLAVASTVLLLATQGWSAGSLRRCDSLSPVYLAPLAVLPPLATLLYITIAQASILRRLLPVSLAAGAAIALFLGIGKGCLAGPFGMLDPVVYRFWYLGIYEGLPIWKQNADTAIIVVLPVLIGIAGYVKAALAERHRQRRLDWWSLLMLASGSGLLAVLVMRAGFVAHLLAMPGAACLAVSSFRRARALGTALLRVPATIVSLALLFPIVVLPLKSAAMHSAPKAAPTVPDTYSVGVAEIAALEQLGATTLLAPIDISPAILLRTHTAVIGTPHHRNMQGMKTVFDAFLASPQDARAIVLRSSASYLVVASMGETDRYREFSPHGLAAELLDGKCPEWLTPVALPGLKKLRLYRIEKAG